MGSLLAEHASLLHGEGQLGLPSSISHTLVNQADETRPVNAALTFFILADSPSQRFPVGSIISFAGNSDPVDPVNGDVWLICDGRQFTREEYPAYWQLLHNVEDSAQPNTFQIPDLRGIFLRGVDPTGTLDPGVDDRTPMFPGGMGGRSVGSLQQDQFSSHQHPVPGEMSIDHDGDAQTQILASPGNSGSAGATDSVGKNMGLETRPINAYLHQLIRVK